jgi:hypothetical protein
MRDDLFAWLDPLVESILEPTEERLFEFLAQLDTFLVSPQGKARLPIATSCPFTEDTYKEMWMLRYQQHMGQITFLELLEKYEEIVGISARSESE